MALIPRFRMVAGPNGSGKTTLWQWLEREYAVNFYVPINADAMFSEVALRGVLRAPLPVDAGSLARFLDASGYSGEVTEKFRDGSILLAGDCFRFRGEGSATTYTVSLLANYFQSRLLEARTSFSQETVFSHPSKPEALKIAQERGFRTYLYYVATDDSGINVARVRQRVREGGHDVSAEKIVARYGRSLGQIRAALPWTSRAYFFDNSGNGMRYLASFEATSGMHLAVPEAALPGWFVRFAGAPRG